MQEEILTIARDTGGDVTLNQELMEELIPGGMGNYIIEVAKKGNSSFEVGIRIS